MQHFTRFLSVVGSNTNPTPTTVTASASANTKGSWVEVHSETVYDFDIYYLILVYEGTHAAATYDGIVVDIGYDASGGTTYIVAVPDILVGSASADSPDGGLSIGFPVHIPNGSAIAARCQSTTGSDTVEVGIQLYGGSIDGEPHPPQGPIVAYGVTTSSDTQGTVLPSNSGANSLSAWQEITSATTHPHRGLVLGLELSGTEAPSEEFLFDVATGASSSEVILADRFGFMRMQGEEHFTAKSSLPSVLIERPIPEGTRLAVRAQGSANGTTDDLEVALYGWG